MTSVKISGVRGEPLWFLLPLVLYSFFEGGREKGRHAPYRVPESRSKSASLFFPHASNAAPPTPSSDTSSLMSPPFSTPSLTSSPTISTCSSMRTTPGYELDAAPERSQRKRSARKYDDEHVRRPANPFILFACEFRNQPHHKGINNRVLSKKAGELWKLMSDTEKQAWRVRASAVKKQHEQDHPDYRYQPRRRKQRSTKKTDYPLNLTFPDPPKSPVLSKVEEADSLCDKALRFPSTSSEDKLTTEDTTLTELSQRKPSSRGPVGLVRFLYYLFEYYTHSPPFRTPASSRSRN